MPIDLGPVDASGQEGSPVFLAVDEDALKVFVFILRWLKLKISVIVKAA
jgi:hypothetical protein